MLTFINCTDNSYPVYPLSEEEKVINSLEIISRRKNNVLRYDFEALTLDDAIRRPNSVFFAIFKGIIELEKSKGTTDIVIQVYPNSTKIVLMAQIFGFNELPIYKKFLFFRLPLQLNLK